MTSESGLHTSQKFASAYAVGTDWRDVARKVLTALETIKTRDHQFQVGFLYLTEDLVPYTENIISLFKSVTQIENWVGCSGVGICATDNEFADESALVAMVGAFDDDTICYVPNLDPGLVEARQSCEAWLDQNEAHFSILHGNTCEEPDPERILPQIEQETGGYVVGALSSYREKACHFASDVKLSGLSGVFLSSDVPVTVSLNQGCVPLADVHTITGCEGNTIQTLDDRPAFEVFAEDLRKFRQEHDAEAADTSDLDEIAESQGEIHIGFIRPGAENRDYLVHNIVRLEQETGEVTVTGTPNVGMEIAFMQRDSQTLFSSLSRNLLDLRERVTRTHGVFEPKGALYFSCAARALSRFGKGPGHEMKLIQEVLGTMPAAGVYTDGEISNSSVYGYASVLVLFL